MYCSYREHFYTFLHAYTSRSINFYRVTRVFNYSCPRLLDMNCSELGWSCIPLVVKSYGAWGREAVQAFSRLASHHLATRTNTPKSKVVSGRLILTLVRANAWSLLLRGGSFRRVIHIVPKHNFVVNVFYLFIYITCKINIIRNN